MRPSDEWKGRRPGGHSGPGRRIGSRIFGALFFLLLISAVVGGFLAWISSPDPLVILLIGLGLIAVFAITMRLVFRRAWVPVSELIDATTRLGEGDTTTRMETSGRGPWRAVSESFNSMATRLEEEDELRRRLLADLGHELRTPLTVIRGEIEAVMDGVHQPSELHNVVDEVLLMERLLEDLRTLALSEAGRLELATEPTDVGQLVEDVVASFEPTANAQSVVLTVHHDEASEQELDPQRMRQVLSNVISNGLSAMPDGGELDVRVRDRVITIEDTGPGIEEGDLESIFDRFAKGPESTGSGLGLRIARDLVEAHGGDIAASNREGGGARFTINM